MEKMIMASLLIGNGFHLNFVNGLTKDEYIKRLKSLIEKETEFNRAFMNYVTSSRVAMLSTKKLS